MSVDDTVDDYSPRLSEEENVNETPALISHCPGIADVMWPAGSHSSYADLSTVMNQTSSNSESNQIPPFLSCFCLVFCYNNRKSGKYYTNRPTDSFYKFEMFITKKKAQQNIEKTCSS